LRFEFAPNSSQIAVVTQRQIRLVNSETGQESDQPILLDNPLTHIAWSPDSARLAGRQADGSVRVFDLTMARKQADVAPGQDITCVVFQSNERLLLGDATGRVTAWNIFERKSETIAVEKEPITALAYCRDLGAILVAHGTRIDIIRSGKPSIKLEGHRADVTHLSVSGNGDTVVSCSRDGRVIRWKPVWAKGNVHRFRLQTVSTGRDTAEISSDLHTLITLQKNRIVLWDAKTGENRGAITTPTECKMARFSPLPREGTSRLVTCDAHGTVMLWAGHSFPRRPTSYVGGVVRGIARLAKPPLMACVGDDEGLTLLDPSRPDEHTFVWREGPATAVAVNPNVGTRIVISAWDGTFHILERSADGAEWVEVDRLHPSRRADALALTGDGNFLVGIVFGKELRWWDLADRTSQGVLATGQPTDVMISMSVSPRENVVVGGTRSGELLRWNLPADEGAAPQRVAAHKGGVRQLCFLADGSLVSAGADHRLVVHDASLAKTLAEFHPFDATCLAAHPSASQLAAASGREIHLWSLEAGNLRRKGQPLAEHSERITALSFVHDGSKLVSAAEDRTVKFWPLEKGTPRPAGSVPIPANVKAMFSKPSP
jgi:WD40 repeat protein